MENILKLKEVYIDTSSFESAKKAVGKLLRISDVNGKIGIMNVR